MKPGDVHQIRNGQLLDGRYRVVEKLGSGAHSSVYKALDTSMADELVCIKLLHDHLAFCERNKERFRAEVRILGNIMHDNVVRTFDCGTTEANIPYIVMEYLSGGDLSVHLGDVGAFSVDETMVILRSLLQALALVHEHGIIHRDIKPSNILLTDDGVAKLIDFGVAKETQSDFALTRSGDSVGSPRYMSPEQLCNREISPASDLYALGLLVFELLSGEPLHTGSSLYAVSVQQNSDFLYERLATLPKQVPASLIEFIEKSCQPQPEARYVSAIEALSNFYDSSSKPKKRRRMTVVKGRRKLAVALFLLGLLVAALVTFACFVRYDAKLQLLFVGRLLVVEEFTEQNFGFGFSPIKNVLQYDNLKLTPEIFERLLRGDRDVSYRKSFEAFTLFMRHAFGENKRIKPSYQLSDGKSLIYYSLINGRGRFVEALVERGAPICRLEKLHDVSVDGCESSDGRISGELTSLQIAAFKNNSAFSTLLAEGINKCGIDWVNYRTPKCGVSAISLLISQSANESLFQNAVDFSVRYPLEVGVGAEEQRSTLLHQAVQVGNVYALRALIKRFPKLIDVQDSNGDTALHYAVMSSNRVFFERLMRSGADPRIKNNEGIESSAFASLVIVDNLWSDHFSSYFGWAEL
jgi:serine/threonine protein kinase